MPAQLILRSPCPQITVGLGRAQQKQRHCEAEEAAAGCGVLISQRG